MDTRGTIAAGVLGLAGFAGAAGAQCPVLEQGRIVVDSVWVPLVKVVADFNGDGTPDLAAGEGRGFSAQVLLGNPSREGPRFGAPARYYHGFTNTRIAAGDLTGDGFPDLLIFAGGSLRTLLNIGDGTFMQGPMTTNLSQDSAVGDLNGDGYADLAAAEGTRVLVYLGNGGGGFRTPAGFNLGGQATSVRIGDFDGDGIPDLAAAGSEVRILLGNASRRGTFTLTETIIIDQATTPTIGDFNGDGRSDVALIGNRIQMLVSDPARPGLAFLPVQVGDPDMYFRAEAATGDLNGDGRDDLIVTEIGAVAVYLAGPDGRLGPRLAITEASSVRPLAVGDFTADGRPDVIVSTGDQSSLFIHANRFCAADFTCDGVADAADYTGYVLAFEEGGARADANGDGFLDFLDYAAFLEAFEAGC